MGCHGDRAWLSWPPPMTCVRLHLSSQWHASRYTSRVPHRMSRSKASLENSYPHKESPPGLIFIGCCLSSLCSWPKFYSGFISMRSCSTMTNTSIAPNACDHSMLLSRLLQNDIWFGSGWMKPSFLDAVFSKPCLEAVCMIPAPPLIRYDIHQVREWCTRAWNFVFCSIYVHP